MAGSREFEFEGAATPSEAADALNRIAEGIRARSLSLSMGEEEITVYPDGDRELARQDSFGQLGQVERGRVSAGPRMKLRRNSGAHLLPLYRLHEHYRLGLGRRYGHDGLGASGPRLADG